MRDLNWETFEDGPFIRSRDRIYVTIDREGRFYFNKKAMDALGTRFVALMYDSREKLIGVRASQPNRRESFELTRKNGKESGWTFRSSRFFSRFNIRPSETLAFTNVQKIDGPILLLDLNDVHSVAKAAK